jgi:hypothetical protein
MKPENKPRSFPLHIAQASLELSDGGPTPGPKRLRSKCASKDEAIVGISSSQATPSYVTFITSLARVATADVPCVNSVVPYLSTFFSFLDLPAGQVSVPFLTAKAAPKYCYTLFIFLGIRHDSHSPFPGGLCRTRYRQTPRTSDCLFLERARGCRSATA